MPKIRRADLYLADRAAGMKYREIAEKYGVSHQAIAQVCAKRGSEAQFKAYTEEEVIYPNVRKWLNENKVSRSELVRRMGELPRGAVQNYLHDWFTGRRDPIKKSIDKLLSATGFTYEEFFSTELSPDREVERIPVSKDELRHLINDVISYIWRMGDGGCVDQECGYKARLELIERLRKFDKEHFSEVGSDG